MAFAAKVILDSIGYLSQKRVVTIEATYPRFIHSEIMTHRDRERNAASSRAIPWCTPRPPYPGESQDSYHLRIADYRNDVVAMHDKCMKKMILTYPVVPLTFGREQRGMQQGAHLEGEELKSAQFIWLNAMRQMVEASEALSTLGVHKSLCNRLTEPWMWITVVMTATEWNNFFRLRCHPAAEQHFFKIANMIRDSIRASTPQILHVGEWHLPYVGNDEADEITGFRDVVRPDMKVIDVAKAISTARCARVSYLTHDGRKDFKDDLKLYNTLLRPPGEEDEDIMHASPFGHVCESIADGNHRSGPFIGWNQHRKEFSNENVEGLTV